MHDCDCYFSQFQRQTSLNTGSGLRLQFKDGTSAEPVSFAVAAPGGDLQEHWEMMSLVSAGKTMG
jgi:hypothetical protein